MPLVVIAYVVPLIMTSSYVIARVAIVPGQSQQMDNVLEHNGTIMKLSNNVLFINENNGSHYVVPKEQTDIMDSAMVMDNNTLDTDDLSRGAEALVQSSSTSPKVTSESDDPCWMLPDADSWKEWIINGPNLCMLMVSIENTCITCPLLRMEKGTEHDDNSLRLLCTARWQTSCLSCCTCRDLDNKRGRFREKVFPPLPFGNSIVWQAAPHDMNHSFERENCTSSNSIDMITWHDRMSAVMYCWQRCTHENDHTTQDTDPQLTIEKNISLSRWKKRWPRT